MSDTQQERPDAALAKLREPFAPAAIGKLPRTTCKACSNAQDRHCDKHPKKDCAVCGNWMTTAHMHLDYVGHAEVTDRLLSVDPLWSWEPMAYDQDGAPLIKKGASGEWELWIRLTVCGVTRPGVGSVATGFDAGKQLVGDALRNAAMRFGVALDLWSKAELESALDDTPITGRPEPTPAQILKTRIDGLPLADKQKLGEWCDGNGVPRVTREMSDAQLELVSEWVDNAEDAAAHATETDGGASQNNEGESEPDAAPSPADVPSRGLHGEPDRYAAACAFVNALDKATLVGSLTDLGLDVPRTLDAQRTLLVTSLVESPDWQPTQGAML